MLHCPQVRVLNLLRTWEKVHIALRHEAGFFLSRKNLRTGILQVFPSCDASDGFSMLAVRSAFRWLKL